MNFELFSCKKYNYLFKNDFQLFRFIQVPAEICKYTNTDIISEVHPPNFYGVRAKN